MARAILPDILRVPVQQLLLLPAQLPEEGLVHVSGAAAVLPVPAALAPAAAEDIHAKRQGLATVGASLALRAEHDQHDELNASRVAAGSN